MNIAPPPRIHKHAKAISWINSLILDLKLQELGHKPMKPITVERLEEGEKHIRDLEQCEEWHICY